MLTIAERVTPTDAPRNVLPSPYLLFLGDATLPAYAKTAFGLRDWAGDPGGAELAAAGATGTTGLPRRTVYARALELAG